MRRKILVALSICLVFSLLFVYSQNTSEVLAKTNSAKMKTIVVPNPCHYTMNPHLVFRNVPADARISVFSIDGTRIASFENENGQTGDVKWRPPAAYGLFIYVVQSSQGKSIGKFALMP